MLHITHSRLAILVAATIAFSSGCAEEATTVANGVCVPNATVACLCTNGDEGYQQCAPDGSGFVAPCDCSGGTTSADAADSSDANDNGDGNDTATSDAADATDATDTSDSSDATNATDTVDSADASDASDTTDASDAADNNDTSDSSDTADNTDGVDTSDGTSITDSTDGSDQSDGSDTTDGTDAIDGMDAADGLNGTDAGTALDATDTSYVSGGGGAFTEPLDTPSCIKAFDNKVIAAAGGAVHRSSNDEKNVTAPIREHLTGKALSGIRFLQGTGCGLDTDNVVWCWDNGPVQQSDEIWSENTAFQVVDFDGDLLRATHGAGYNQSNTIRNCVVREDTTIACWGSTGGNSTADPNGQFPETPGCAFCAAYPTSVRDQGGQGEILSGFTKVFVTPQSIAAIDQNGALWVWGSYLLSNAFGGDLDFPYHVPRIIEGLPPISDIVVGYFGACVIGADTGEVICRANAKADDGWITLQDDSNTPIDGATSLGYGGVDPVVIHRQSLDVWLTRLQNINFGGSVGTVEALTTYPIEPKQGANAFTIVSNQAIGEIWAVDVAGDFHVMSSNAVPNKGASGYPDFYDASQLPAIFASACLECVPSCGQAYCGTDGCGGICSNCAGDDYLCVEGLCVPPACTPNCPAGSCGPDGCGGTCGDCEGSSVCSDGACVESPCLQDVSGRYGLLKTGAVLYMCSLTSGSCNSMNTVSSSVTGEPVEGIDALWPAYQNFTCGMRNDDVWCWAAGSFNGAVFTKFETPLEQTDNNTAYPIFLNEDTPLSGITALATGANNACAITSDSQVLCWGADTFQGTLVPGDTTGVCDTGNYTCNPYPTAVLTGPGGSPVSDATAIGIAGKHACILRTGGTVWCWGREGFDTGVAGWEDSTEKLYHPTQIEGFPMPAVSIHVADKELCAVLEDTTVWCVGKSTYGMVGKTIASSFEAYHYPEPIRFGPFGELVSMVEDVALNYYGKTFLLQSGEVLAMGFNGIAGSNAPQPTPDAIAFNSAPVDQVLTIRAANSQQQRAILRANGDVLRSGIANQKLTLSNIGPVFPPYCAP